MTRKLLLKYISFVYWCGLYSLPVLVSGGECDLRKARWQEPGRLQYGGKVCCQGSGTTWFSVMVAGMLSEKGGGKILVASGR